MSTLTDLVETALRQRAGRGYLVTMPTETATAPVLPVEIRQSRAIVLCPWCPGATIYAPDDPRFFCVDCCNMGAGGKYVPVKARDDWREVVAQLMKRPDPNTRNAAPHETLAQLVAEDLAQEAQ